MAKVTKSTAKPRRRKAAVTPEARENQMIALAIDLAEKQLREGTASSQVITHFLKLGTSKADLEKRKLENETELLEAKTEMMRSAKRVEELYSEALDAMRHYGGHDHD